MADTLHRPSHRPLSEQKVTINGEDCGADISLDQLDYMADLISEFREMSQRSGMSTLAGILALAQSEAAQQIANRRKR